MAMRRGKSARFFSQRRVFGAGEGLPSGVNVPGALVGGLQPVPPAKNLGRAGSKEG